MTLMKERHLDFSVNAIDEFELGVSLGLLDGLSLDGLDIELDGTPLGKL